MKLQEHYARPNPIVRLHCQSPAMPSCSILENKSMGANFQKKGEIFQNLGKNVENFKCFEKGLVIVCNNRLR